MADKEPEVLFEIDAAKILAKLHLAGLQPCTYDQNKEFIVNTGIKNDDPKAKPENPGKVEFDLGNSQGEYELGFVTSVTYKFHQQSKVRSTLSKIDKLASELAVAEKDKEKKPILVKQEEEDDKKKQEIKDILDDPAVQDVLKKSKIDYTKFKFDSQEGVNAVREELKKHINDLDDESADEDDRAKQIERARVDAIGVLKTYLNVFVGPDKVSSVKDDDVVTITVAPTAKSSSDNGLVANYEIQAISDQERAKMQKQFEANPKKDAEEKVCFKIGYTVQLDK